MKGNCEGGIPAEPEFVSQIGRVQLAVKSIEVTDDCMSINPQFFTFLNDEGKIVGKVLARFALTKNSDPRQIQ